MAEANSNMEVDAEPSNSVNADLDFRDSEVENPIVGSYSLLGSRKYKLEKNLGLAHGFSLMVGLIMGSGIFISPGLTASDTSSTGMMLIVWVAAGFFALMGSLCYCELASIVKMAGGNYANILFIYGKLPGFLCAWSTCLVIDPSSVAAIGMTVGLYLTKPFYSTEEEGKMASKLVAFAAILFAGLINCISVRFTNKVQRIFAVAQISSVIFVVGLGIWQFGESHVENFHNVFNGTHLDITSTLHVGIALFGALWSFDGWAQVNNVVEEIQNVERNLLLTVLSAFPFVICCYVLVNVAFLTLLSRKDMASSNAVGVDFVKEALGVKVAYLMMVLVGLSSYGTLNGTMFACPRLTLAAAREGHMPFIFSLIHRKNGSPIPAILLTTAMASIMLIPDASNLNSLILLFSQAQWMMYGTSILGVIILRLQRPSFYRPFKVFIGVPILVSLVSLYLVIIPFFRTPLHSVILLVFILSGIPFYFIFIHFYWALPKFLRSLFDRLNMVVQKYFHLVPCSKEDL